MSILNTFARTGVMSVIAGSVLAIASTASAQSIAIQSQLVLNNLVAPVGVYAPPGDNTRIFILQQTGQILVYSLVTNSLIGTYLDIGPTPGLNLTAANGERGLLGLAFHPDFATNGFFYVNYTSSTAATLGDTFIRRYTANAPFMTSTTANTSSGTTLITVDQPFSNHNGGSIRFGPDRMLYIFMGDGGDQDDPAERAQNDTELLGKILRIDVNDTVNGGDGDGSFIPDNNPYRADGNPRDKVWAKGTRNPWRSTFDRVTGDLWVADVGQNNYEEIDVQPAIQLANPLNGNSAILNSAAVAGLNYGWDCREGLQACPSGTGDQGCDPNAGGYFNPIIDYSHSFGCSITGGYVYRGSAIPALDGLYIYADYCTSATHRVLRYDGTSITFHADIADQLQFAGNNLVNITSYGEDGAGELYICVAPSNGSPGSVYKIVPFPVPCGCPCAVAGPQRTLFADSFEISRGWTVTNDAGLTAGAWLRSQPANVLSWQWDPMTDADGNGWCVQTGNGGTNSDIDGGSTTFTSPALDFSLGQISICYSYQFATSAQTANDGLFVDISSNGNAGPWTRIATHQTDYSTRWIPHNILPGDLAAAGVTNTANMRIRFVATDGDAGNNVEAALDNFKIITTNVPDCNNNGVDDLTDISSGTSLDANGNQIPDECDTFCACEWNHDGILGVPDIFAFLSSWFSQAPEADFDGQNGIGVPDIFAFLSCWFAQCP